MKLILSHSSNLRPQTVVQLRELLEGHLGPQNWTDDEVAQMAVTLMRTFAVLLSMPSPTATGDATASVSNPLSL